MSESTDPKPTLLFIPDISGFTKFVNETEITHSQHIVQELLEIIINANQIGLKVSEVEGDAILFYREGQAPRANELREQIENMYIGFHAHLKLYDNQRICQCGACRGASDLSLKFVAHYGDVVETKIKEFTKLFGREVIVAHRLLKNDLPLDEYVLVTEPLFEELNGSNDDTLDWAKPALQQVTCESGELTCAYMSLAPVAARVPDPVVSSYALPGRKIQILERRAIVQAPIDMVFSVVSDLSFRHKWQEGLKDSTDLNSAITRGGSTHRCVIKGDDSDPVFVSHDFQISESNIAFTDSNSKQSTSAVFRFRKIDNESTEVIVTMFMIKNLVKQMLFRLIFKRKLDRIMSISFRRLNTYCQDLVQSGKTHPGQVLLSPTSEAVHTVRSEL